LFLNQTSVNNIPIIFFFESKKPRNQIKYARHKKEMKFFKRADIADKESFQELNQIDLFVSTEVFLV